MAIEIYKQPTGVVFTDNQIIVGVRDTNQLNTNMESCGVVRIEFKVAHEPVFIVFNYSVLVDYRVDISPSSNWPFPTVSEWCAEVMVKLATDKKLTSLFHIRSLGTSIYFIERTPIQDINIEIISTTGVPNRIEGTTIRQSSIINKESFHAIGIRPMVETPVELTLPDGNITSLTKYYGAGVEVESIPNYTSTDEITKISDGSLYIEHNISGLIGFKKKGHFNLDSIVTVFDVAEKFLLECYRKSIDSETELTVSQPFYAINAKIDKNKQAELNELGTTMWQSLIDSKRFMTWSPNNKHIDVYHPEIINFPIPEEGDYTIHIREYNDGDESGVRQLTGFQAKQYQVASIVASYINIYAGIYETVTKFDIWLQNLSGEVVSTVRTYYMDYTYQANARWWLFKNSHGVYETIRTTGLAKKSNKISKTFIDKDLPADYTSTDRDREQVGSTGDFSMTVNSGPLTKEQSLSFDELLDSDDVYLLLGGKALPVEIESGTFLTDDDKVNLIGKPFKVTANRLDDQDIDLTIKLPIAGDFSLDFGLKFSV